MPEAITISNQYPDAALDYNALREEALAFVTAQTSAVWTDHNLHDPGITMMEVMCFAITDLSYRASLPMADLLASAGAQALPKPLFSAAQILPARPLTITDYRKCCIDTSISRENAPPIGIKNAWLQKRTLAALANFTEKKLSHQALSNGPVAPVRFKGFYDVLLEFDADATKAEKALLLDAVRQTLQKNRNLCEDFLAFQQVETEPFRLCAEVELEDNVDPFEALAQVFVNISLYLTPLVNFYDLKTLMAEGLLADEIFEGPPLQHGFLKTSDLLSSQMRRDIRLSDVIQEMFKVPGVQNANNVALQPLKETGAPEEKWILAITEGKQPVLNLAGSRVVLYKNDIPFVPNLTKVMAIYTKKMRALQANARRHRSQDLPTPQGTAHRIADYTSIQHHFPKTYGIGNWGLNDSEPDERKAKALQLHGYLWLMDQLMGDYLAQLAQMPGILSSNSIEHTLHTKLVHQFHQSKQVLARLNLADAAALPAAKAALQKSLQALAETEAEFFGRRHTVLDHLIARFAEDFAGYVYTHDALFPATSPAVLIAQKEAFLNNYPQISQRRGGAHHHGLIDEVWDTTNLSGYEVRVRHLLGISQYRRQTATKIYTAILTETVGDNTVFRFAFVQKNPTVQALVSSATCAIDEACQNEAEIAVLLATDRSNYTIAASDAQFALTLSDKTGVQVAQCPHLFDSAAAAEQFLERLLSLLAVPVDEAVLVIEHHLLLPSKAAEAWLNICVDGSCEDCNDLDPYSLRLSVVLPAQAGRFTNMDFRRFAENLLRREVPAHLLPKICWVSTEAFSALEDAWQQWLRFKAGAEPTDAEAVLLQNLVTALQNCKNVYPKARLQDCSADTEKQLLVLNKASLGTIKNA
jgi:uncharacterized protein